MKAKCCRCKKLESENFATGAPGKIEDLGYRCSVGKYDKEKLRNGTSIPQYFAWGGIVRPNKTVAAAQAGCQEFEEGGNPRG
jgi:hypothetical protein